MSCFIVLTLRVADEAAAPAAASCFRLAVTARTTIAMRAMPPAGAEGGVGGGVGMSEGEERKGGVRNG